MAMTRPVRRDDATARRPTMDDPPGGVPDHGEGNGGSKELDMSSWRHVHVESPQGARVKLDSDGVALEWTRSKMHFDNVAVALLTLYEVAGLELWLDIM